jgi:hypothetical protein
MSAAYIEQTIESRYIKDKTLINFLDSKKDEFGHEWSREV